MRYFLEQLLDDLKEYIRDREERAWSQGYVAGGMDCKAGGFFTVNPFKVEEPEPE